MDRVLERAFNKVHVDVGRVQQTAPKLGEKDAAEGDNADAPDPQPPARDAIQNILKLWKAREYFQLLQLPQPHADDLGRPVWECTQGDVSRAFRRLSVLVHPDKNPGDDARAAFEALNETHRILKDAGRLEEVLRDVAERVRRDRDAAEARVAGVDGRAALAATKNAAIKRMRKQEGAAFDEAIRAQMRKRQEVAARKAAAVAAARVSVLHAQEGGGSAGAAFSKGDKEQRNPAPGTQGIRPASVVTTPDKRSHADSIRASSDVGGRGGDNEEEEDDEDGSTARRRAAIAAAAARKRKKISILH